LNALQKATVGNTEQNTLYNDNSFPEQNVPQTFTINNVSSYVLSCNIYNTPVSFLVDTGAGVSLLNKEVWDKLEQTDDVLNPVVTQRIVGVDGIPIRIEGCIFLCQSQMEKQPLIMTLPSLTELQQNPY